MKKFVFRLEALLKIRRMKEDEAKQAVTEAIHRYLVEEKKLRELITKKEDCCNQFKRKQNDIQTIETLKNYLFYIDKISEDVESQKIMLQIADKEKKNALKILVEASRERDLLDKLKEKQYDEYRNEILKQEQDLLDEQGLQAFMKNN